MGVCVADRCQADLRGVSGGDGMRASREGSAGNDIGAAGGADASRDAGGREAGGHGDVDEGGEASRSGDAAAASWPPVLNGNGKVSN